MPVPLAAIPVIAGLVTTGVRGVGKSNERWITRSIRRNGPSERLDRRLERAQRFNRGAKKFAKATGLTVPGTVMAGAGTLAKAGKLAPLLGKIPIADSRKSALIAKGIRAAGKYDQLVGKVDKIPFASRFLKLRSSKDLHQAFFSINPGSFANLPSIGGREALRHVAGTAARHVADPRNWVNRQGVTNAAITYAKTGDLRLAASAFVTVPGRIAGGIAGLAMGHFSDRVGRRLDARLAADDSSSSRGLRGVTDRTLARVGRTGRSAADNATRLTGVHGVSSLAATLTNFGLGSLYDWGQPATAADAPDLRLVPPLTEAAVGPVERPAHTGRTAWATAARAGTPPEDGAAVFDLGAYREAREQALGLGAEPAVPVAPEPVASPTGPTRTAAATVGPGASLRRFAERARQVVVAGR